MTITVTQKHIDRGVHGDPRHCPLAIAINEQCPAYESVVFGRTLGVELISLLDASVIRLPLSPWAVWFIYFYELGRLEKKRWWHRWTPREYVFDLALPESSVTERVETASVLNRDLVMLPQLPPPNPYPDLQ